MDKPAGHSSSQQRPVKLKITWFLLRFPGIWWFSTGAHGGHPSSTEKKEAERV